MLKTPMKTLLPPAWAWWALSALALALLCAGCAAVRTGPGPEAIYRADLRAINADVARSNPQGTALFEVYLEEIVATVSIRGLPPGMMHMQHLHGFEDGREVQCPDEGADTNDDGIIDLFEAEAVAGRTLIPLHDEPAHLAIQGIYPTAGPDGSASYSRRIPRAQLENALKTKHGMGELDLSALTIMVHGVERTTALPSSVKTLPGVPQQDTLPIACGRLEKVD